jgi:hypothetical protein
MSWTAPAGRDSSATAAAGGPAVLLHWELAGDVGNLAVLDAVAGLHLTKCELYLALPGSRPVCFPSQATQSTTCTRLALASPCGWQQLNAISRPSPQPLNQNSSQPLYWNRCNRRYLRPYGVRHSMPVLVITTRGHGGCSEGMLPRIPLKACFWVACTQPHYPPCKSPQARKIHVIAT